MAGEKPLLFDITRIFVGAGIHHLLGTRASGGIHHLLNQRMLRRQNHARRPEDGVHARGEDANRAELGTEVHLSAL